MMPEPEIDLFKEALRAIVNVLGTGSCTAIKCPGCQYEMQEAADIARQVLGFPVTPTNISFEELYGRDTEK